MARYKKGIQGPFKGRIGNVVGVTWRGIEVMRALPESGEKPPTEKQLNQRFVFALVNSWLKPLRELIWVGYQLFTGTKTPMNGCVSYHMKHAVTGNSPLEYAIDFARVILSRGELLVSFIKEVLNLVDAVLHIKWENAGASIFNNDDDRAIFVVYNPAKKAFVSFENVAQRGDKEVKLQLPATYINDTVHCWQHFVNAEGDAVSTSIYIGEMVIS